MYNVYNSNNNSEVNMMLIQQMKYLGSLGLINLPKVEQL